MSALPTIGFLDAGRIGEQKKIAAEVGVDLTDLLTVAYRGPMNLGEISTLENGVVR
ncbi:hypothetical protein [Nocardia sp. CA-135398]|uniref:hypothetical protein n=1 Tax=Nocardia sp. CA-135398 TaxID=3239977 RepID=UPI003D9540CB